MQRAWLTVGLLRGPGADPAANAQGAGAAAPRRRRGRGRSKEATGVAAAREGAPTQAWTHPGRTLTGHSASAASLADGRTIVSGRPKIGHDRRTRSIYRNDNYANFRIRTKHRNCIRTRSQVPNHSDLTNQGPASGHNRAVYTLPGNCAPNSRSSTSHSRCVRFDRLGLPRFFWSACRLRQNARSTQRRNGPQIRSILPSRGPLASPSWVASAKAHRSFGRRCTALSSAPQPF